MSNYINWMIDNKTRFWQSIALGMALLLLAMSIVALGSSVVAKLSNDNKPVAAPPPVPVAHVAPPAAPPAPAPLVYDPPCGPGSNAHVCTEQITKKSRVQGRIHTVTYDSSKPISKWAPRNRSTVPGSQ